MALTGRLIFSAYRRNQYDLKNASGGPATQGVQRNYPAALCKLAPVQGTLTANGVAMQTVIEFLPSGLYKNGQSVLYYTADTIATLNTNGS